jgi:adenylate cyclase class 2
MSFEVEIKFRTEDHDELTRRLLALGAEAAAAVEQEDVYLRHPMRDFAVTGEALRVRREGTQNRITYKGPRHEGPTKTREEIEIAFTEGDEAASQIRRLWDALGFRPVAVLHKRRSPFHLVYDGRHLEVGLDLAEDVGTFAEVETLAADAGDLPQAQATVLALAGVLGLSVVEPRSYLRMALERRGEA